MVSLPAGLEIKGQRLPEGEASAASSASPAPRGRGLYATRSFAAGAQIAVLDNPLAVLPASADATSTCNWCLNARKPAKACTGCRSAAYCGPRCQKAHWKAVHKLECKVLKEATAGKTTPSSEGSSTALVHGPNPRMPTPVRAMVQLLLQWPTLKETVGQLETNVTAFKDSPTGSASLWADFHLQAVAACAFVGWKTTDDIKIAERVLCAIHTNSFDRSDPDVGATGSFLDATLAMANHSCVPNAVVIFTGRKAILRAEQPIAKGDEITISYIDYTKPKSARQKGLALYHFTCDCIRCSKDLDVYQVCRKSPLVSLNQDCSFVSDAENHLKNPPLGAPSKSIPAHLVDQMYAECAPEVSVPPQNRLANLRRMWAVCQPLIQARQWAVEPLAHVFQQAIAFYSERKRYEDALAVECFVARNIDPYKYVAPFAQWRLKGLLVIAMTLANTVPDTTRFMHPRMRVAMHQTGDGTLYEALLLMVLRYGPQGHSEDWELLDNARDMLEDIQGYPERAVQQAALNHWLKDPKEPAAAKFFKDNILMPFDILASFAVDIMKKDFDVNRVSDEARLYGGI